MPRNAYCSFCRKSHRDVGPLVEGPGDVYICGECIELCQSIIDQERRRRVRPGSSAPGPEAVRAGLDQLVSGQDEAKEALALAAGCRHESTKHVLLIGPSRSSKLFLARALAHVLEVPFTAGDSNGLVKTRWGGAGQAIPLLYSLLRASDFDLEAAQHGVVYLDGVDLSAAQVASSRLWQEQVVDVIISRREAERVQLDIRNVLFVCGGAFTGLREASAASGRHPEQPVTADGLVAFGARPEWVRHLRAIACAAPFDVESLGRIAACLDFRRLDSDPADQSGRQTS